MNWDHFHPCPRADPVTDRRPEVSPTDEPGANISEGVSEMGPDQCHQYPCVGATHRMTPAAGASIDPTQRIQVNLQKDAKRNANLPGAVPTRPSHRSQASGGSPHL